MSRFQAGPSRREVLGASAGLPLLAGRAGRHPSFLVVLADQLTWWMTDPAQRGVLDLANLDRMRAEGTSFERCYATSPVCSAARLALRTGLFPHRNPANQVLQADTPTVEERLRANGYRTHYVGKWHLGPGGGPASGYVPPGWRPDWDSFVGHQVSHTAHVTFANEDPTPIPTGEWDAGTMTDFALDRIREDAAAGRPFFMQVNYLAPHTPYHDYPSWLAVYDESHVTPRANVPVTSYLEGFADYSHYMNATRGVDLELGRLLDEIDARQLDVVVIFTSDHGDMLHSHGQKKKRSPLEESARIPMVVRGPGWGAGAEVRYPVGQIDVVRTLAGLGQGTHLQDRRDSTFFEMNQAAGSWMGARWRGLAADDGWKLAVSEAGPRLLSDLTNDPFEFVNLAGQGLAREDELYLRMREWAHETGDDFFG